MTLRTLALLAALVLAPSAAAHINNFADTKTIDLQSAYYVQIDPQPQPLYANESTTFTVYVTSRGNGTYVTQFTEIHLTLEDNATTLDVDLKPTENDTLEGTITFPHRGNYTTTLKIREGERHVQNTTWMDVYHDYGFIVVPVDDFVDPLRNRTTVFHLQTIDPDTRERERVATDMRLKIDHWDDAHTRVLRSYEVTLTPQEDGTFRFEDVFTELGQYHMYVASDSAGLAYDDAPMLHVFVTDPIDEGGSPIPGPAPALIAALVLILAAIAVSVYTRRRRP